MSTQSTPSTQSAQPSPADTDRYMSHVNRLVISQVLPYYQNNGSVVDPKHKIWRIYVDLSNDKSSDIANLTAGPMKTPCNYKQARHILKSCDFQMTEDLEDTITRMQQRLKDFPDNVIMLVIMIKNEAGLSHIFLSGIKI